MKLNFFCLGAILINFNINYLLASQNFFTKLWNDETENIQKEYQVNNKCAIELTNIDGDIIVKGTNENKVIIKMVKNGKIDNIKNTKIEIKANSSKIILSTNVTENINPCQVMYTLFIPNSSSLKVKNLNKGNVKITHVDGPIDVSTYNGTIDIIDSIHSVVARADKGNITIKQKYFKQQTSIFLETITGNINLYLPRNVKANINAKTQNGIISCEHEVTLYPLTLKLNKETWNSLKKEAQGTLSGGGAPITIESVKSNINIYEYLN